MKSMSPLNSLMSTISHEGYLKPLDTFFKNYNWGYSLIFRKLITCFKMLGILTNWLMLFNVDWKISPQINLL